MTPLDLDAVVVGDEPEAWEAAGFVVDGSTVDIGGVAIECEGDGARPRWRLRSDGTSIPESVDGIPTAATADPRRPDSAVHPDTVHPNTVLSIDHVVLTSPDLDRTTECFGGLGIECRRVRDVPGSEPPMQQRFFRLGGVILELVGRPDARGDGPASLWGLACTVTDLDAAADHLGSACSTPKDAVQPGRRIATVRTRELGISLTLALMTPHPGRT